jgi:hypothetical protein
MDEDMVVLSKLEGSYEKVNQVVSVGKILQHSGSVNITWMKTRNTYLISFCHSIPRKI